MKRFVIRSMLSLVVCAPLNAAQEPNQGQQQLTPSQFFQQMGASSSSSSSAAAPAASMTAQEDIWLPTSSQQLLQHMGASSSSSSSGAASSGAAPAGSMAQQGLEGGIAGYQIMAEMPGQGGNIGLPAVLKNMVYEYLQGWQQVAIFPKPVQEYCGVNSVALSSDQSMIVTGDTQGVVTIRVAGQPDIALQGPQEEIRAVGISAENNRIVAVFESSVRTWTINQGVWTLEQSFDIPEPRIVVLSPDLRLIALGFANGRVQIYRANDQGQWSSTPTATLQRNVGGRGRLVSAITISHDNRMVVVGYNDGAMILYGVNDQGVWAPDPLAQFESGPCPVASIAFSSDNHMIVSGFETGLINLWTVDNGVWAIGARLQPGRRVRSVVLSSDRSMVVAGLDNGHIALWHIDGNGQWPEQPSVILKGHASMVKAIVLSADKNMIVSGSEDGSVIVWKLGAEERFFGELERTRAAQERLAQEQAGSSSSSAAAASSQPYAQTPVTSPAANAGAAMAPQQITQEQAAQIAKQRRELRAQAAEKRLKEAQERDQERAQEGPKPNGKGLKRKR